MSDKKEPFTYNDINEWVESAPNSKEKIKIYKLLTQEGLNPTQFYITKDKVISEEDRKKLLIVRIKHEI
jgi:hypothetical protein